ncbi:hypothetical protein M0638_19690 [Roseomonas sp. NAR14]|uniref:Uncharacterized protein n=1 Tax=Roseomonas acroporae TaxID=2937791 RepID=A0A9X1YDA4_9PROT|nr:hypothetical protein [Roseomonas acroporae]MCK8786602.1 hypothetical protein [Roseomonas acroporae]
MLIEAVVDFLGLLIGVSADPFLIIVAAATGWKARSYPWAVTAGLFAGLGIHILNAALLSEHSGSLHLFLLPPRLMGGVLLACLSHAAMRLMKRPRNVITSAKSP